MFRRRRTVEPQPVEEDLDPWSAFLKAMHLTGGSKSEATASEWELQVIRDPLFDKFLRYGPGRSNIGPKTVGQFLSLPDSDKRFYAKVFENWKKVIKERNIPIEQLE
jgi:hypothetical protein